MFIHSLDTLEGTPAVADGLSISEAADQLGFSGVYREWFNKEKISSECQFSGRLQFTWLTQFWQ